MDPIVLNWQGPIKFLEYKKLTNKQGIYIHSILTNPERIWYVGQGKLKECQQRHRSHFNDVNLSTVLVDKLKFKDFYDLCSNDQFNLKIYAFLEPDTQQYNEFKILAGNSFNDFIKINNCKLLEITNIYYAYPEKSNVKWLESIEANIQYFLIKEFMLDLYKDNYYKIGLRKNFDHIKKAMLIQNKYDSLTKENIIFFHEHFRNCIDGIIDLREEDDQTIQAIKNKKVDQKWSEIMKD